MGTMRSTLAILLVAIVGGSGPIVLTGPAAAEPGDLRDVATSDAGVAGNGSSSDADISDDGRLVTFSSLATNLDLGDSNTRSDVYVKDLSTGDVRLVSSTAAGDASNGASGSARISGDGTVVVFASTATDLDPADTDAYTDVYAKNLDTGVLQLVTVTASGVNSNREASGAEVSDDGSAVVFASTARNLDPRLSAVGASGIYVKFLATGELAVASSTADGVVATGTSLVPTISGDGNTAAFASNTMVLDPADTDRINDLPYYYYYVKDLRSGVVELTDLAESTYFFPDRVSLSRDGTRMAFTERLRDVYLRDFSAGTKEQLDVADGGRPMNRSGHATISADGAKVAFATRKAGANPGDDRGTDVFVTDIRTSDLVTASTTTDGGVLTADADYPSLSADGGLVAFSANGKVYLKTLLRAVPVGIGDASAVESDEPTTLLPVVVSLGAASPVPVTVLVRTRDQTATAGVDYLAGERELVFAPGQTTQLIFMHIYGDDVAEPTETFTLDLLFTSLAWLADSQAIITITDDD